MRCVVVVFVVAVVGRQTLLSLFACPLLLLDGLDGLPGGLVSVEEGVEGGPQVLVDWKFLGHLGAAAGARQAVGLQ